MVNAFMENRQTNQLITSVAVPAECKSICSPQFLYRISFLIDCIDFALEPADKLQNARAAHFVFSPFHFVGFANNCPAVNTNATLNGSDRAEVVCH